MVEPDSPKMLRPTRYKTALSFTVNAPPISCPPIRRSYRSAFDRLVGIGVVVAPATRADIMAVAA